MNAVWEPRAFTVPATSAPPAVIALAAPAFAQSQLSFPHLDDENVVVSATRVPTPVANVASSVTVITAADIEARQDRSLPDVLREVPGLFITQTGGAGGQTSLFMRGTNSNHTKVLLDGIDIADPSTANGAADVPASPRSWPAEPAAPASRAAPRHVRTA